MTENHINKLLERLNSDTKLKILQLVDIRVFNGITQVYMAKTCKVSKETIKRFENLKVNSLSLFINYKFILEDLPNKKKKEVPKWVFNNQDKPLIFSIFNKKMKIWKR